MADIETRIRAALGDFYDDPMFLEKLAAIMVQLCKDDQEYVPENLLGLMSLGDGYVLLATRMCDYFSVEERLPSDGDENMLFSQALPDAAAFVLSNRAIPPVIFESCEPVFHSFFLRLLELSQADHGLAKAGMFFGVAMALYEWRDRQRGGIPYDPDIHGPITFATDP